MAFTLDGWVPTKTSSAYRLMTATVLTSQSISLLSKYLDPQKNNGI